MEQWEFLSGVPPILDGTQTPVGPRSTGDGHDHERHVPMAPAGAQTVRLHDLHDWRPEDLSQAQAGVVLTCLAGRPSTADSTP